MKAEGSKKRVCLDCREIEVMRKASLFMKTFNPVTKCKSKMKDKLIIEDRIQIIPSMLFSPFDTKFLELSSSPVSSRY